MTILRAICLYLMMTWAALAQEPFWIETMGSAPIGNGHTQSDARRHALAEAIIVAGMAGGSDLRGYSVLDKGRILSDRAFMRPMGMVHRYEIARENRAGQYWQVSIRALVGPMQNGPCAERRHITVNAYRPAIRVSPTAPAWADGFARDLGSDLISNIAAHPDFSLEQMMAKTDARKISAQRLSYDYASLTGGVRVTSPADHTLNVSVQFDVRPKQGGQSDLHANVELVVKTKDFPADTRTIHSAFVIKEPGLLERWTGSKRARAIDHLAQDINTQLNAALTDIACRPPVAKIQFEGGELYVNLGARHGVEAYSLGFVSGFARDLQAFEVTRVSDKRAVLRPIGALQDMTRYRDCTLHFLKTRLP